MELSNGPLGLSQQPFGSDPTVSWVRPNSRFGLIQNPVRTLWGRERRRFQQGLQLDVGLGVFLWVA